MLASVRSGAPPTLGQVFPRSQFAGRPSRLPRARSKTCGVFRRGIPRTVDAPFLDLHPSPPMPHVNPPDTVIRDLLLSAYRLAFVGASSNPARPSYGVMSKMQRAGYRIVPVNPSESHVLGEKAYASLDDVEEPVDVVVVFRRPEHTPGIAEQAVRNGARALWLQQGIVNEDAARIASGLTVVMDDCIAVAHSRLRIPSK